MTQCPLCPHHCGLREGQVGLCRARVGKNGQVVPLGYGKLTSIALDPIEKKPLARFYPGSMILSAGSFGCNMACYFCQNDAISFAKEEDVHLQEFTPRELVDLAVKLIPKGNIGIAFTYNEPLVNFEYIRDCAALLKQQDLKTVIVTNGCFCLDALGDLLKITDAFNIDLKGFTQAWYRRLGGDLETVKRFIKAAQAVSHVELTTLIVPGENDSEEEMAALSSWVAGISPRVPLHLSRFFPRAKAMDKQPTDTSLLLRLCEVAREHLEYVYPGNI